MTDSDRPVPRGFPLLQDPRYNKSTAFTEAERDALGLRGLLPPRVMTLAQQLTRVRSNLQHKGSDLDRYIFLAALQDRNETLFFRLLVDDVERLMPIVYTPTVGEACQKFGHIFRRPRGLYLSTQDRGRIAQVLANWPEPDVRVIVVTDGERILGLGDLGAHGMGISIGKLNLYVALAGIHPHWCLPVMLDVGTDRESLRHDPLYTGLPQPRVRGGEYDALVTEFIEAATARFPRAVIQFEDFATENAIRLLSLWRDRVRCFNDDIQGTAAVTLAGLFSAGRITGVPLEQQRILFLGAGSAATGIADLIVGAMVTDGMPEPEARVRCWFSDSKGLVVGARTDLPAHKRPYAHDAPGATDLLGAIDVVRPTTLIGVSGQGQTFTEAVVDAMVRHNERPVIFALSNPTANAECTAEQAYRWSKGRAVFASGSPFDPVDLDGQRFVPGQGNNAYIFPGVGLGVMASGAKRVTDRMFAIAARTLADLVDESQLAAGTLYPPLGAIRSVSAAIAVQVAAEARDAGLATEHVPSGADLAALIRETMYEPAYRDYA
ncbi:MAG: NAD-dependent malic enzyme [Gemmatimonadales bacterium]